MNKKKTMLLIFAIAIISSMIFGTCAFAKNKGNVSEGNVLVATKDNVKKDKKSKNKIETTSGEEVDVVANSDRQSGDEVEAVSGDKIEAASGEKSKKTSGEEVDVATHSVRQSGDEVEAVSGEKIEKVSEEKAEKTSGEEIEPVSGEKAEKTSGEEVDVATHSVRQSGDEIEAISGEEANPLSGEKAEKTSGEEADVEAHSVRQSGDKIEAVSGEEANPLSGEKVEEASGEKPEQEVVPNDNKEKAWYYNYVNKIVKLRGVEVLDKDNNFRPTENATRNDAFDFLKVVGVTGFEIDSEQVEDEQEFLSKDISREEVAYLSYLYAKAVGKGFKGGEELDIPFEDKDEVSDEAVEAVAWCYANKILIGRTPTILAPQDYATRAELATIMVRLVEKN